MEPKKMNFVVFFILSSLLIGLHAQEITLTTGNDISGDGGEMSYSIGLVFYTTNIGTNGSVANGVQQTYEISDVTAVKDAFKSDLNVLIYPNPAADYIQIQVDIPNASSSSILSCQLFNMHGKLLHEGKLTGNRTSLNMKNYVPATYIIHILIEKKVVKTYKLIKN